MCGIFGFISRGRRPNLAVLRRVALNTQTRGVDAWGLAWVDRAGAFHSFKEPGPIEARLSLLSAVARDAVALLGHTRLATHGSPADNVNNHPHLFSGGAVVHNGVILHHRLLVEHFKLAPQTRCDSEVLALLLDRLDAPGRSLARRAVETANLARGSRPFAMAVLSKRGRLLVCRANSQPLHVGRTKGGNYFASLPDALPGDVAAIDENVLYSFRVSQSLLEVTQCSTNLNR